MPPLPAVSTAAATTTTPLIRGTAKTPHCRSASLPASVRTAPAASGGAVGVGAFLARPGGGWTDGWRSCSRMSRNGSVSVGRTGLERGRQRAG